jgi:hypothetical protein
VGPFAYISAPPPKGEGRLPEERQRIADLLIARRLPSNGKPNEGFLLEYSIPKTALARAAAVNVDRWVDDWVSRCPSGR